MLSSCVWYAVCVCVCVCDHAVRVCVREIYYIYRACAVHVYARARVCVCVMTCCVCVCVCVCVVTCCVRVCKHTQYVFIILKDYIQSWVQLLCCFVCCSTAVFIHCSTVAPVDYRYRYLVSNIDTSKFKFNTNRNLLYKVFNIQYWKSQLLHSTVNCVRITVVNILFRYR